MSVELPSINKTARMSTSYSGADVVSANNMKIDARNGVNEFQSQNPLLMGRPMFQDNAGAPAVDPHWGGAMERLETAVKKATGARQPKQRKEPAMRIVKVFIADPDKRLPLEDRVLYQGPEKMTDLDDNELFFEVPIVELLKAHNEKRVATVDKKASHTAGTNVTLDPIRVRDLKMVVVDIATF